MAAFDGSLTGHEAVRVILPQQCGTIIFTGAAASLRGHAHFAVFSGAKFALRALVQRMARELGSKGICVVHPIVDGTIDTNFIRETLLELYERREQDGILDPEHIAETY